MIENFNAQMEVLPAGVHVWMNWMLVMFMSSLLFVWRYVAARYVLGTYLLSMAIGMGVFYIWPNVHLLGVAHLIAWTPLLVFLLKKEVRFREMSFKRLYDMWLMLLSATITISLIFDIRDIILLATGNK